MVALALDQVLRARLMMALLGLIVVGVGLIALVILAGRAARRAASHRPPSRSIDDRWYAKPLVPDVTSDGVDGDDSDAMNGRSDDAAPGDPEEKE
jgi:hypothetical protein